LKNIVRKNQSDPTPYWLQEREIHRYLGVAQDHMVKISHEVPMVVSSCKSSSVKYCLHKFWLCTRNETVASFFGFLQEPEYIPERAPVTPKDLDRVGVNARR
jgi:hypothetical protein